MLTAAKGCAGQSECSHASWDGSLVFSQLSPGTRVLPPGAQRCSARAIAVGRAPHTLAAAESEPLAPGALTRARFPPEGSGAALHGWGQAQPEFWLLSVAAAGALRGGQQLPPLCPRTCGPAPPSEAVNFRFHCGFCFLSCVMVSGAGPVCVIPAFGPFVMLHTAI